MKWDPLVHWMAHVGEGSWASFKRAALAIAGPNEDISNELRRLRLRLSDLGYAEFFVGTAGRWRSFQPLLAASPHLPGEAFLCGARTDSMIRALREHAGRSRCTVLELSVDGLFRSVHVRGNAAALADAMKIRYEPDIALRLSAQLPSIDQMYRDASARITPANWTTKSFDFHSLEWVEGTARRTVVEYKSPYNERLYLLERGSETVELPKREALYAAAALNRMRLAQYFASSRELRVPWVAPLPEPFARVACVAAGRPSVVRDGLIVYENVPARLATVLLVGVGHLAPRFQFPDREYNPNRRPRVGRGFRPPRRRR